jgi:hypothetical protein
MKEGDHQSTWLGCWSVWIQTIMVNELGCCNAGVERACHDGEGHRADAWEKLGKETGKQQAFIRELEHHGKIVKCNGRKNFVYGKKIGGTSPSYIGFSSQSDGLWCLFDLMLAGTSWRLYYLLRQ